MSTYEERIKRTLTNEEVLGMLKRAAMDSYLFCPYCDYGDIEPDYDKCPECHRKNPLKERGMI
jgi:DNA-directed RNA polymerase subunit RPC12/RpoP